MQTPGYLGPYPLSMPGTQHKTWSKNWSKTSCLRSHEEVTHWVWDRTWETAHLFCMTSACGQPAILTSSPFPFLCVVSVSGPFFSASRSNQDKTKQTRTHVQIFSLQQWPTNQTKCFKFLNTSLLFSPNIHFLLRCVVSSRKFSWIAAVLSDLILLFSLDNSKIF